MEVLKPKIRFPEFHQDLLKCKLSDKMNVFRGASPRPKGDPQYYGGLVPRLMIQDATRDGKYVYPKIDFLTEAGAKKSRFLKKDSVVLSCSGTVVAIPTILGVDACIHDGWLGFNNFKDINTEFLYYSFVKLHDIIQGSATTGGVFNNLTTSIIKDYEINFPSILEQTKIANFLSEIDEKINLLKEKKSLLEEYKKGIMQKIFNRDLRFQDDNGNDFEEWEEKSLGEVTVKKSSNISANKIEENEGKYIIYGASGILKTVDFYLMKEDYISIVKDGAGVGRIFYCQGKTSVLGTLEMISPIKNINTYFIYCLLNNIDFTQFVTGSTIPHIYYKDYSKVICGIPCPEEQTKIANFLSSIDEKIELVNTQIQDTQEYKKGLLQQMFV
jgi:type I restriction enzyme S subunit